MTNYINEEEQFPRWLIEEQLAQQKKDAKYLVKYNKRQVEKEKLILAYLEKSLMLPKLSAYLEKHGGGTLEGTLNAIDETRDKIRMYRREVMLYVKYLREVA
tara:strand:- start:139 stop:444 length:306 start_codon:yes stop_codon:yes gene_type:complete